MIIKLHKQIQKTQSQVMSKVDQLLIEQSQNIRQPLDRKPQSLLSLHIVLLLEDKPLVAHVRLTIYIFIHLSCLCITGRKLACRQEHYYNAIFYLTNFHNINTHFNRERTVYYHFKIIIGYYKMTNLYQFIMLALCNCIS